MKLKIISPEAVNFEGEVQSVTLPGAMGAFTVLKNHASLISTLVAGKLVYTPEAGTAEESLAVFLSACCSQRWSVDFRPGAGRLPGLGWSF